MISVGEILSRLQDHQPEIDPQSSPHRAEVALVLDGGAAEHDPSIIFIQRSPSPDDPWSGQMAFPGGGARTVTWKRVMRRVAKLMKRSGSSFAQHNRWVVLGTCGAARAAARLILSSPVSSMQSMCCPFSNQTTRCLRLCRFPYPGFWTRACGHRCDTPLQATSCFPVYFWPRTIHA